MAITSASICAAAEQLLGFVAYNLKTHQHIVRFSEDAFGLDVDQRSIMPVSEFVWDKAQGSDAVMTLKRERLSLLLRLNIDEQLAISEPLRVYLQRTDLPEIQAERRLKQSL